MGHSFKHVSNPSKVSGSSHDTQKNLLIQGLYRIKALVMLHHC